MKKAVRPALQDALKNKEKYIRMMEGFPDKKLQKHLDLFRQQMQMAYKQGNHEGFTLLQEKEWQTFMARLNKFDKELGSKRKNKKKLSNTPQELKIAEGN